MKEIPYESGSYYVFDRGYNAFKELFKIHQHESFFIGYLQNFSIC